MSNSGYNNKKRSYSSNDNSFSSKVKKAIFTQEYLDSLEKNAEKHTNSSTQHEIPKSNHHYKKNPKKRRYL